LHRATPHILRVRPGAGRRRLLAHFDKNGFILDRTVEACGTFKIMKTSFRESLPYWGGDATVAGHEPYGEVKAIDPATGRQVWTWRGAHPMVSSLLTTGGDLVFAGEPNGMFNAYDARTGGMLWQFNTGSGIHGNPITYSAGGKQYVAVPSGWGGWMKGFAPEAYGGTRGSALFVFALP
jgi:alcohol dehydrogenase (cytochrome c)